jgi:hypothetical protein
VNGGKQLLSRLLHEAAVKKQVVIADAIGKDKSTVSRWLACEVPTTFDNFCEVVAACDLALIPAPNGATVTIPADRYQALLVLAGERMSDMRGVK